MSTCDRPAAAFLSPLMALATPTAEIVFTAWLRTG